MIQLRDYQNELIVGARQHFRAGRKRVLIQLATGGGKTALCARMLHNAIDKGKRCWFNVHRRELARQVSGALKKEGVPHGLVMPGERVNLDAPVQVCSIPTLVNRFDRLPPPDLIAFDECHHIGAKSWELIMKTYPDAYYIGLSATPQRLDGIGLANYFHAMVCGPSPKWLIEKGFLAKYQLYEPEGIDRSLLQVRAGKYTEASAERVTQAIVGNVVSHYRKHIDGARAILFAASVKKSQEMAQLFTTAGIPAFHLDGKTDDTIRDGVMDDLASGKIRVVTNVNLFSEGFDCPALDAVIDISPTMSMGMYRQRVGRMLRPSPGKEFGHYLDCVGNVAIHGKPDDEIEWELTTGQAAKKKNAVPPPRVCAYCWASTPAGRPKCKVCRRPFPVDGRKIKEIEGDLVLTDQDIENRDKVKAQRNSAQEQGRLETLEALIELGRRRGMGNPEGWAGHVMAAREAKEAKKKRRSAA